MGSAGEKSANVFTGIASLFGKTVRFVDFSFTLGWTCLCTYSVRERVKSDRWRNYHITRGKGPHKILYFVFYVYAFLHTQQVGTSATVSARSTWPLSCLFYRCTLLDKTTGSSVIPRQHHNSPKCDVSYNNNNNDDKNIIIIIYYRCLHSKTMGTAGWSNTK